MKKALIIPTFLLALNLNGQPYNITFSGSGASSSIATVKVENLTAKTSLEINGTDILCLGGTTSITKPSEDKDSGIQIYPNPITESSIISFKSLQSGKASISVFDASGRLVGKSEYLLDRGFNEFNFSGLVKGFYTVVIQGTGYHLSDRIVSIKESQGNLQLSRINSYPVSSAEEKPETGMKGSLATVNMAYTAGDRLKFTGISGNYSTVVTDIPSSDKEIAFTFIACTDGSSNNYPVVQIGTQTWMAENLKTTSYSSGTAITQITSESEWNAITTTSKGFCYYNFDSGNGPVYGAIYTWAGAMNGASSTSSSPSGVQGACPTGWHIPSMPEWTTLTSYLVSFQGSKLKEIGFTYWGNPLNGYEGGTNETGFSARGAGFRQNSTFGFDGLNAYSYWWSTTDAADANTIKCLSVDYTKAGCDIYAAMSKYKGVTVRCVKD